VDVGLDALDLRSSKAKDGAGRGHAGVYDHKIARLDIDLIPDDLE
jgi:hypothetical protein